ncbi:MAG TPA: hypothetical protein VMV05_03680, partial [bacterium]|nr:hypothetical protein [bacterium]
NALSTFQVTKVVRSFSTKFGGEEFGDRLVRFDSYDSNRKLRSSQWRNKENGTQVEALVFSGDGKPLTMIFYYKLKVNRNFKPIVRGHLISLSLDQVVEKFGAFDYSNPDQVIDVCIKLLHFANSQNGKNGEDD